MLLVRVASDKSFAAELTSIDDILMNQIVTAEAAFCSELQRTRLASEHFLVGMSDLEWKYCKH